MQTNRSYSFKFLMSLVRYLRLLLSISKIFFLFFFIPSLQTTAINNLQLYIVICQQLLDKKRLSRTVTLFLIPSNSGFDMIRALNMRFIIIIVSFVFLALTFQVQRSRVLFARSASTKKSFRLEF